MPGSTDEQVSTERFNEIYRHYQTPVMLDVERAVTGCDYGGTSWTTRDEADRLGRFLALRPGTRLLEVGAGSGWPGLYLARTTNCDVTLVDLPMNGLRIATERIARDDLRATCSVALSDGGALPFRGDSFDAIIHSDVLC